MTIQEIMIKKGYKLKDSGAIGKAFEIGVKQVLKSRGKHNKRVTPNNWNYDVLMRKGELQGRIEVKSACGELAKGFNTAVENIFPNIDYVIYSPEPEINLSVEFQSYVFTRDEFIEMLQGCPSMVRAKKTTNYYREEGGKDQNFYRLTIQSFYSQTRQKASKRIRAHIDSYCTHDKLLTNYI